MARTVDVGSFDLLLDTITNAFGGILFIAILVVILLRLSGERQFDKPIAEVDEVSQRRMERQFQQLAAHRDEMRRALEMQARIIQDFAPDDIRTALEELNKSRERREELAAQRDQLLNAVQATRQQIGQLTDELKSLDQELERANRELAGLRSSQEREIESRTSTARAPMARRTSKYETVVIVRYGRLYVPYRSPSDRLLGQVNSSDMVTVREDGSEMHITPKPYAGLTLEPNSSLQSVISRRLSAFASNDFYLCVAIWDDSFERFEPLKEALIALGYEYRLIPVPEGEKLTEGPVRDALVQ